MSAGAFRCVVLRTSPSVLSPQPQLSGAVDDVSKLVEAQPALLLQAAVQHDSEVSAGWSCKPRPQQSSNVSC